MPETSLLRRGSDQAQRSSAALPSAQSVPAAGGPLPGLLRMRWSLPAVAALLAVSGAALAAASAWLLSTVLSVPASPAAAAGAALALLATAVPTLAMALSRLRSAPAATGATGAAGAAGTDYAPARDLDTGAFRRDLFMELAEREWARARRYGSGAGLLVVDIDRLAWVAETHGAAATDALLNALTRLTSPTLRGADLVTRLAPMQLGVFLAQADPTGALDVAERIRERAEALDLPWPAAAGSKAVSLRCTVSVGVASLRPAHLNLQALLQDAEDAVAAARLAGGNCVRAAPVDAGASPLPGASRDDFRARPQ